MAVMTRKFCPQCGSEEIELVDGDDRWMCAECGYTGKFPEHTLASADGEVEEDDLNEKEFVKYKSKGYQDEDEDEEDSDDEDEDEETPKKSKKKGAKSPAKKASAKKPTKKPVKKTALKKGKKK